MDKLSDVFGIFTLLLGPDQVGFPTKRPRRYFFLWRLDRFQFDGTPLEFCELFWAAPTSSGDAFLLENEQDRTSKEHAVAKARGN